MDLVNGSVDVDYISESVLQDLRFGAHCWDSLAGLKTITLSVGSFSYGNDVYVKVVDTIDAQLRLSNLRLVPGVDYFLTVEVEDHAGWITRRTSDGFRLDLSSPLCMEGVKDGRSWLDRDFQSEILRLDANYQSLSDAQSPISEYRIGAFEASTLTAGPSSSDPLIGEWISRTGSSTWASIFLRTPLQLSRTYYIIVEATNAAGHVARCMSDGVAIDTRPPVAGVVEIEIGSARAIDASSGFLLLSYDGFHDAESSVESLSFAILELDTEKTVASGRLFGGSGEVYARVELQAGRYYQARVTALDLAGNEASASSKSVLALANDFDELDASNYFDAASIGAFPSARQVEQYISSKVLPRLSAAKTSSGEFRWCLSTDRIEDDLRPWASPGQAAFDISAAVKRLELDLFFIGIEFTNEVAQRRSIWSSLHVDGNAPVCMSVSCLWISSPGSVGKVRHISSRSSLTCRFGRIHDASGIDFFILEAICTTETGNSDRVYPAVRLDALSSEHTFIGLDLGHGGSCHCSLWVYDVAGNYLELVSDPALIDHTRPTACAISTERWYSSHSQSIIATISEGVDTESGISRLELSVLRYPDASLQRPEVILEKSASTGPNSLFSKDFASGDPRFRIRVKIWNHAGLVTTTFGNEFQFDDTPPILDYFWAGDFLAGNSKLQCTARASTI